MKLNAFLVLLASGILVLACSDDENPVDTTPGPLGGTWDILYVHKPVWSAATIDTAKGVVLTHTGKSITGTYEMALMDYTLQWNITTDDNIHARFEIEWIINETGESDGTMILNGEFTEDGAAFETEYLERRYEDNTLVATMWFEGTRVE